MSPACSGFEASASPGGMALDSTSRQRHQLLPHTMQVKPYSLLEILTS